jgi:hypothetical protein
MNPRLGMRFERIFNITANQGQDIAGVIGANEEL